MQIFVSYIWIVRLFRKNISKAGKVVSQVRCDFNEKGYVPIARLAAAQAAIKNPRK